MRSITTTVFAITVSTLVMTGCQAPSSHDQAATAPPARSLAGTKTAPPNADLEHTALLDWASARGTSIEAIDDEHAPESERFVTPAYVQIPNKTLTKSSAAERNRNETTAHLYFKMYGRNTIGSLIWTGIESGNPLTRHEDYRWDSLKEEGMYDHARREKLIAKLKALGIRNVRIGMSNHLINLDDDSTWAQTDAVIHDLAQGGLRISLDMHHFGIEDRFRVVDAQGKTVGEKSYYLNPAWPDYFAKFVRRAVERYHNEITAITIMNEPETVIGFNGEMWHGGFPGWSDKNSNRWYIERGFQVAKASVKARLAIESYLQTLPMNKRPRFMYVHTEASVFKAYWDEFNLYRRYMISDMILGNEWFLRADLQALAAQPLTTIDGQWGRLTPQKKTILEWVEENYLIYNQPPETREALRQHLVAQLKELRSLHEELAKRFGKTMKTDAVFAVDYYGQNEDKGADNVPLDPQPQFYADEVRSGNRSGLYRVIADYYNHFIMPMMVGESGTPYYYYGARWNEQMLLEVAQAGRQGIPFLAYTIYPAVDTWGWESACSVPRSQAIYNPSGIMPIDSLEPRPFIYELMKSLGTNLPR